MIPAAVLKRMRQIGLTDDQFDAVAEMLEEVEIASQVAHTPVRSARQERNARYYQAKKDRLNASENVSNKTHEASDGVLDKTIKTLSDASKTLSGEPAAGTDLARARGIDAQGARGNPNPSLRSGLLDTPLPSEGPQADQTPPEKPKRSSGTALPQDWSPSEDLFAYGSSLGLSRGQSAEILERMRLWALSNRNRAVARKADWNLTAMGFLRRDAPQFAARAGPSRASPGGGFARLLADSMRERHEREQQERRDFQDVPVLPVVQNDGHGTGGDDDGGVSRNRAQLLIEASFKRL